MCLTIKMFLVLWVALILNSILITKQVSYHNIKAKNSLLTTRKINSQTAFNQKFRNFRKTLRKERRNFANIDVNDWGYEDISEPLQYNHKEVWWTNYYPDQDITSKNTKINNFTKKFTKITTKPTSKVDLQVTTKANVTSKLIKPNNVTKSITTTNNVTKLPFGNLTVTTKTLIRSEKKTTQTEISTKFTDVNKGIYLPVLTKNDNGEFSILANKTNLLVRKNENDSEIHGSITDKIFLTNDLDIGEFDFIVIDGDGDPSKHTAQRGNTKNKKTIIQVIKTENMAETIKNQADGSKIIINPEQSKILPNVIKDGIYRIEIPDPVTKKTNLNPENVDANAPQNNYPPRPLAEGQNIQGPINNLKGAPFAQQPPFYNTKYPGYKKPLYSTGLGQNGQGHFFNPQKPGFDQGPFRSPQIPDYDRPGPFYGKKNLGQNRQGPFYSPQNPGFDQRPFRGQHNQGPFYGPNNFGQNGHGPFYMTQNPGFGKQSPFYGPQNPNYGRPRPNYGTNSIGQNRQGPFYNPQNQDFDRRPFHGPQNPDYYRPGPNYGTNSIGQNGQGPSYNTQNQAFGNQMPFYDSPNPDSGPPNYGTNDFEQNGPEIEGNKPTGPYIVQNPSNDIQGPSNDITATELDKKTTDLGRQGVLTTTVEDVPTEVLVEAFQNEVFGTGSKEVVVTETTALTNEYHQVIESTRSTFEPGKGPRKDVPDYFEDPAPISTYVKHLIDDMEQFKVGFFSMFLIKFFEIIGTKKPDPLRRLMSHAQLESVNLFEREHLLIQFGEPFVSSMTGFANSLDTMPVDLANSAAVMLHHTMVNRRDGVTQDINSVIDYIDSLYEDDEGIELLKVVEDIDKYPDGGLNRAELHRKLSKVMYEPVRRLAGTAKKQILIESLNKVIANHMKVPPGAIERRQGSNLNSNFKFHFIKGKKGQTTNNERKTHQQATNDKKKGNINSNPTKRYSSFKTRLRSTASMKDTKHEYRLTDKTKIRNNNNKAKMIKYTQETYTKRINKFKVNLSKTWQTNNKNNSKYEINKAAYFFQPFSETTVNGPRFTTRNMKKFQSTNKIITEQVASDDKIDKLKEIIAEQILEAKANNFKLNAISNNAIGSITNHSSVEETEVEEEAVAEVDEKAVEELFENENETMTQIESLETEATTTEPSIESSKSIKQHKNKKDKKHKYIKTSHLHKKEIRHLQQKHPKMYENYLRHLKKSKHDKKHKKGRSHGHKKKSHHSNKKKRSKISRKIQNIEHHYEHLLRHYMMRKSRVKIGINDNKEKMSEECKDILNDQNDTNEYSYLYNSFKSIEKEISEDIKLDVITTPNFALAPFKKSRFSENDKTTKNWFHYPIFKTTPRTYIHKRYKKMKKNHPINRLVLNSESINVFGDSVNNFQKNNLNKHSSSSDEEQTLKFNLDDAMRHDGVYVKPLRRASEVKKKENKLRTFSSYSNEEAVLKSNIYKAVGFNKYHSRANFSDIIRRDSIEKAKKMAFRSDSTSSSDDAEDILKQKLGQL